MRAFHRRAGAFVAPFLFVTAVTGLLWAYAPHLYWKEGYLKKKVPVSVISWDEVRVGSAAAAGGETITSAVLKKEGGRTFYVITPAGKGGEFAVDASTGERLSPFPQELAAKIAAEYGPQGARIVSAGPAAPYVHRGGKKYPRVFEFRFDDAGRTAVWVNADNGAVVEESDRVRRLHFWVTKLHQLSFFGTKKELTAIPGLGLLALLVTGLVILRKRRVSR